MSCDNRLPLSNKLNAKVERPASRMNNENKPLQNTSVIERPESKNGKPIRKRRILSGTRIKSIGAKKMSKISSQPLFKRYNIRKASYLGYIKSSKLPAKKSKSKKKASINQKKVSSRLHKKMKLRDHSSSVQS